MRFCNHDSYALEFEIIRQELYRSFPQYAVLNYHNHTPVLPHPAINCCLFRGVPVIIIILSPRDHHANNIVIVNWVVVTLPYQPIGGGR